MAIVKMKRLRLAAMKQDRESLLELLQRMGCVEIDEPSAAGDHPCRALLQRPEGDGLDRAREGRSQAERAIGVLKRYAPEKSPFLAPRPEAAADDLFCPHAAAEEHTQTINALDDRMAAIQAQQSKLQTQLQTLAPWLPLELPLETESTDLVAFHIGTLPLSVTLEEAEERLGGVSELHELTEVSADRERRYLLLVCHAGVETQVMDELKRLGWGRATLKQWVGTAQENTARIQEELKLLEEELADIRTQLSGMGGWRAEICRLSDARQAQENRQQVLLRALDTRQVFFVEGWIPAENAPELEQALADYPAAVELTDPAEEDYPDVPVQLKNNWFTRPLNMVTDMYALPAYGSLDPNPLMAPFFIFFYGFMMADMGYGLLMMLASLVVMKKAKPDGPTMRHLVPLLGLCGVSTFIMGALTGGFFGDLLPQLAMMIDPDTSFTALPALFSPLDDALAVLIGSLLIGLAQIFTGMAISMRRKIKKGEVMDALCSEGAWYLVFVLLVGGIALGQVKSALIAIVVLLVLTQGYGKKGIVGKLMGIGGSLYNNITGYFSNILSYSRLMALMLAGAVIAQVFNTLGALTGNVIFFFIIAMVGNALNMALNLLGCYVHDMRLQCLEYFGYFYEDGGKPFRPLDLNTKYHHIVKE